MPTKELGKLGKQQSLELRQHLSEHMSASQPKTCTVALDHITHHCSASAKQLNRKRLFTVHHTPVSCGYYIIDPMVIIYPCFFSLVDILVIGCKGRLVFS